MQRSVLPLILLLLAMSVHPLTAQDRSEATAKGAMILSGTASLTSLGQKDSDERYTTLTLNPSLLYFISPGIGLGTDLSLTSLFINGESAANLGIGPKVAYFLDTGSSMIPYLGGGISFLSYAVTNATPTNGFRVKIAGGLLFRQDHLGFLVEAGYTSDTIVHNDGNSSASTTTLFLAVGFAGLFY